MKACKACGQQRPESMYYFNKKNGIPFVTCKLCISRRSKERNEKIRNGTHVKKKEVRMINPFKNFKERESDLFPGYLFAGDCA